MVLQPSLLPDPLLLLLGTRLPVLTDVPQLVRQVLQGPFMYISSTCMPHANNMQATCMPHAYHMQSTWATCMLHIKNTCYACNKHATCMCAHVHSVVQVGLHGLLAAEVWLYAIVLCLPLGDELLLVVRATQVARELLPECKHGDTRLATSTRGVLRKMLHAHLRVKKYWQMASLTPLRI